MITNWLKVLDYGPNPDIQSSVETMSRSVQSMLQYQGDQQFVQYAHLGSRLSQLQLLSRSETGALYTLIAGLLINGASIKQVISAISTLFI
jgi:hypothetical protein